MDKDTEALVRRIEKLERQNKWIKLSGVIILLSIVYIFFYGVKMPKIIRANEFCVIDKKGKVRGEFGVGTLGLGTVLSLSDEKGIIRGAFGVTPVNAGLVLFDEHGKVSGGFGVDKSGTRLSFYDKKRQERGILGITPEAPGLSLRDENGKILFSAP